MKNRSELVGKIILSNFLEWSVEKFIGFVTDVERSSLYNRLVNAGVIMPRCFVDADILYQDNDRALAKSGVIARVVGSGDSYSIHYTAREFSVEYQINKEKLAKYRDNAKLAEEEMINVSRLLHKLRRIGTRNLIVHKIVKAIVEHQKHYFTSNNEIHPKPLTGAELARLISGDNLCLDFTIDTSRISRATRGLSLIAPWGDEVPLRSLFASTRDVVKKCIKVIVSQETKDVGSGRAVRPYTDEELRHRISKEYGLSVTRREVSYCRKELGILSYLERNGYVYHTLAANFSQLYSFTTSSVVSNTPAGPGVYELCLESGGIDYPAGCCQTFYIGSAKNLRRRLLSHLSTSSKNGGIKRFVRQKSCVFRFLRVPQRWAQEEKRFYDLFISTYGDSPLCNHMRPKATKSSKELSAEKHRAVSLKDSNNLTAEVPLDEKQ